MRPSTPWGASAPRASTLGPGFADDVDLRRFEDVFAVVVLPTLNEEAGLARTLRDLPSDRFHEPDEGSSP